MSQKTYERSKILIQVNKVARIEMLLSWIISLANAKSLFKINFGLSIFICQPIFKILLCIVQRIQGKILLRKYFASLQIKYELSPKSHSQETKSTH